MSDLAEIIVLVKEIGLTGADAKEFIKEQQDRQRDERKRRKEERELEEKRKEEEREREEQRKKEEREREEQRKKEEREQKEKRRKEDREYEKVKHERAIELAKAQSRSQSCSEAVELNPHENAQAISRPHGNTLAVPKFQDAKTKDVRQYLALFEGVMSQNNYPPETWALALRTAVMSSKLSDYIETLTEYSEMKKEILSICGHSPQEIWRELVSEQQVADESFRQLSARTRRRLETFLELATDGNDINEIDTLTKYIILDKASPGLKTHLVENKIASMILEDFQAAGLAYQEAHGRPRSIQATDERSCSTSTWEYMAESPQHTNQATTNVWRVTVEYTKKKDRGNGSAKKEKFCARKQALLQLPET